MAEKQHYLSQLYSKALTKRLRSAKDCFARKRASLLSDASHYFGLLSFAMRLLGTGVEPAPAINGGDFKSPVSTIPPSEQKTVVEARKQEFTY
jgi:hypothetical protein